MSDPVMSFAPVAVSSGGPLRLAMQRLWLTGKVLPAGGHLVVQHVFRSCEERPLEVIYSFPLPRDAALRAFRIVGEGFEAHSELKQTGEAVKGYEQAITKGSLAALVRPYRDGMVNLTVGNVRPEETVTVYLEILAGVESRDDGFRFRFPFTVAPSYHARLRVADIGDEVEMELPAEEFGDLMLPRFRKDAAPLHEVGFEVSLPNQWPVTEIGSPSHSVRVQQSASGPAKVSLAREADVPNRDLVLDLRFADVSARVMAGMDGEGKRSFAAVVPSTLFGQRTEMPRRIAMLLDRSGSMQGAPIEQARKAIAACLATLTPEDSFGLAIFNDKVEQLHSSLVKATREERECAGTFLKQAEARGGTELARGVQQAAKILGGQGDILIITDGQVFGTEKIVAEAHATGIRISCLGIGSASQDRFLSLLARETGGVSRFVTPGERVDLPAVDLFASMGRPVATGLRANGNVNPELPRSVFSGTPIVLFGEMEGPSSGGVELTWDGGRLALDVPSGDSQTGEVVRLLRGARLIADWEIRYPSEELVGLLARRRQKRVGGRLAELSKMYGLASREMSLVAVVTRVSDRPGELPETVVVPLRVPEGAKYESFRPVVVGAAGSNMGMFLEAVAPMARAVTKEGFHLVDAQASIPIPSIPTMAPIPHIPDGEAADLMDLAAMLQPDGGMPGRDPDARAGRTMAAIFAFVAAGHTDTAGAFRLHVARLLEFLKTVAVRSEQEAFLIARVMVAVSSRGVPPGPWVTLARDAGTGWKEIEAALR